VADESEEWGSFAMGLVVCLKGFEGGKSSITVTTYERSAGSLHGLEVTLNPVGL
jgi:hypothetical protein